MCLFLENYLDHDSRSKQLSYVRSVAKPHHTMRVRDFCVNLSNCNEVVTWMPGKLPSLTDEEFKMAFYNSMNDTSKAHFVRSG